MSLDMYLATLMVLCLSAFAGCTNITVSDDMTVTESIAISGKHTAVVAAQHEKTSHDIYIQDGKAGDGTGVAVEAAADETAEASVPTSDPPPSSSGSNSNSDSANKEGEKQPQEHNSAAKMAVGLSLGFVLMTTIGITHL